MQKEMLESHENEMKKAIAKMTGAFKKIIPDIIKRQERIQKHLISSSSISITGAAIGMHLHMHLHYWLHLNFMNNYITFIVAMYVLRFIYIIVIISDITTLSSFLTSLSSLVLMYSFRTSF